MTEMIMKEG